MACVWCTKVQIASFEQRLHLAGPCPERKVMPAALRNGHVTHACQGGAHRPQGEAKLAWQYCSLQLAYVLQQGYGLTNSGQSMAGLWAHEHWTIHDRAKSMHPCRLPVACSLAGSDIASAQHLSHSPSVKRQAVQEEQLSSQSCRAAGTQHACNGLHGSCLAQGRKEVTGT